MIFWTRGSNIQLTKNFNSSEFECPCGKCSIQKIDVNIIEKLQNIREQLQNPITVTSGYRCQEYHNELTKQGYETSPTSQHLHGKAVDITAYSTLKLLEYVTTMFYAVGVSSNFLHVDSRSDKDRLWVYKSRI